MSLITRKLPATEVSGKASQRQSYRGVSSLYNFLVRGVTVTELGCFVYSPDEVRNVHQSRKYLCSLCVGALQPVRSQLREGWPFSDRCVYIFGVFRGQSRIDYKSVRDFAIKCSVFLRIMQLLRNNYL